MKRVIFEACVDSIESALNAKKAEADRLELCSELSVGGLTPSAGLINAARQIKDIDINVLIRPRSGDFCYNVGEVEVMLYNIKVAKDLGVDGVVIGALTKDSELDIVTIKRMIQEAKPLSITFHRAFDLVANPHLALEQLINLGVDRILTSGQASTALLGKGLIRELHEKAKDRIIIMPGAGVSEHNIYEIVYSTGVSEVHGSGKIKVKNINYNANKDVNMGTNDDNETVRYVASIERLSEMITNANKALNDKR